MIEYLGNRVFYSCAVKGYNTGLQQGVTGGDVRVRTYRPAKLNVKIGIPFSLYFGIQYSFGFSR